MKHMDKISVVLPAYNERGNICKLIDAIIFNSMKININPEIIVVDDNSPDKTGNHVINTFKKNKNVKTFIRTKEKGFATAIRFGIEKATGDIVLVMDTDFNHDPKLIPQMIESLKYYDVVSTSRYIYGGGMSNRFRYFCSYLYNIFIRIILRTKISDNLCGYFAIRRRDLLKYDFDRIFRGGGEYFFRFLYFAKRKKVSILEIPIVYGERKYGSSKNNFIKTLFRYTKTALELCIFKR